MREIKFRIYDKKEKVMLPDVSDVQDLLLGYGNNYDCFKKDDVEIMQFTGLLDKNGKEIYEGDIIDLPITDTCAGGCCSKYIAGKNGCSGHMRRVVEWEISGFVVNPHGADNGVEIIGNIYENPELLKA